MPSLGHHPPATFTSSVTWKLSKPCPFQLLQRLYYMDMIKWPLMINLTFSSSPLPGGWEAGLEVPTSNPVSVFLVTIPYPEIT